MQASQPRLYRPTRVQFGGPAAASVLRSACFGFRLRENDVRCVRTSVLSCDSHVLNVPLSAIVLYRPIGSFATVRLAGRNEAWPGEAAVMTAKDDALTALARSREDFMKRLFAVAVSVGFASPLTRMGWIEHGTFPNEAEWQQITILATALLATIGSWEGYFSAINNRPLKGVLRFIIDIVLVLFYMVLLISAGHSGLFLPIMAIIFVLYVIWDGLTIYEHPNYYYYGGAAEVPGCCIVISTYRRGIFSRNTEGPVRRGHIITVLWTIYFLALLMMRLISSYNNAYVMCAMTALGLVGYRLGKATGYDQNGTERLKTGRTLVRVLLLVLVLLGMAGGLGYACKV
jgi:hypothetical protein